MKRSEGSHSATFVKSVCSNPPTSNWPGEQYVSVKSGSRASYIHPVKSFKSSYRASDSSTFVKRVDDNSFTAVKTVDEGSDDSITLEKRLVNNSHGNIMLQKNIEFEESMTAVKTVLDEDSELNISADSESDDDPYWTNEVGDILSFRDPVQ